MHFPFSIVLDREPITFANDTEFLHNGEVFKAVLWGVVAKRTRSVMGVHSFVATSDSKLMGRTYLGDVVTYSAIESSLSSTANPAALRECPRILAQNKEGTTIIVEIAPGLKKTFKAGAEAIYTGLIQLGMPLAIVTENDGHFKTVLTCGVKAAVEGAPTGNVLRSHVKNLVLNTTGLNPNFVNFDLIPFASNPVGEPVAESAVCVTFDAKFSPVVEACQDEIETILAKIGVGITHEDGDGNTFKLIVAPIA